MTITDLILFHGIDLQDPATIQITLEPTTGITSTPEQSTGNPDNLGMLVCGHFNSSKNSIEINKY